MKIREVIDELKAFHEPFEEGKQSRDIVIAGDVEQECTGVLITICATYEIVKKAKEMNANLIITHESIFYGSRIDQEILDSSEVYNEKKKFIDDKKLVIYRDHDRMHGNGLPFHPTRVNPDYIFYGICKELGWDEYVVGDKLKPLWYKIPTMKATDLADLLIEKFHLRGLRTVGNMNAEVSTVWFCEHINGNQMDGKKIADAANADAIIPFEIVDYTLSQYVNDAAEMGLNKVILEMGHFNCEELGMKYMETWMRTVVDIPVNFVWTKDLFDYYKAK